MKIQADRSEDGGMKLSFTKEKESVRISFDKEGASRFCKVLRNILFLMEVKTSVGQTSSDVNFEIEPKE